MLVSAVSNFLNGHEPMATAIEQAPVLTIGATARHFGLPAWKVRRLYERGLLPPAARAGLYGIVPAARPDGTAAWSRGHILLDGGAARSFRLIRV